MLSKVNVPKTSLQLVAMCCLEVAGRCPAGQFFLPSVLPVGSGPTFRRQRVAGFGGAAIDAVPPSIRRRRANRQIHSRSTDSRRPFCSIARSLPPGGAITRRLPPPDPQKKCRIVKHLFPDKPASAPRPQSNTRRSSRTFRPSPSFANVPATCTAARSSRKWSSRVRATFPRPAEALGPLTASLVSNNQTYSATDADDACARLTAIHPNPNPVTPQCS